MTAELLQDQVSALFCLWGAMCYPVPMLDKDRIVKNREFGLNHVSRRRNVALTPSSELNLRFGGISSGINAMNWSAVKRSASCSDILRWRLYWMNGVYSATALLGSRCGMLGFLAGVLVVLGLGPGYDVGLDEIFVPVVPDTRCNGEAISAEDIG